VHVPLRKSTLEGILSLRDRPPVVALPPFIHEKDLPFYREEVANLAKGGVTQWELNNLSHVALFDGFAPERAHLIAGAFIQCLNSAAMERLRVLGFEEVTLLWESDRDTMAGLLDNSVKVRKAVVVYARPPLFISRIPVPAGPWNGDDGERYFTSTSDGFSVTRPARAFSLTSRRDFFRNAGADTLALDLRGEQDPDKALPLILQTLRRGAVHPDTKPFNFLGRLY
jgi:hypothetical protein